jgi:hypothetical protein
MAAPLSPVVRTLSSALLYAPGAFFFYPWKPLMNALVGDSYGVAYAHFRRDHSDPLNLVLHAVCLTLQVLGNFGLLRYADAIAPPLPFAGALPPVLAARWVSALTATTWAVSLGAQPAPLFATALSLASIGGAFLAAPHLAASELEAGCSALFVAAILLGLVLPNRRHGRCKASTEVAVDVLKALAVLGLLASARALPQSSIFGMGGALVADTATPVGALLLLVFLAACLPLPIIPTVVAGALGTRVVHALTAQEPLLYWGCAFSAMALQGRAHDITHQEATLLNLEGVTDKDKKLRFEWAHVCFFPSLLWHSIWDSAMAGSPVAAKKAN